MKLKAVILLCVCSLLSMTGCSGKEEQPEVVVDNFEKLVQNGEENPTQEPKTEMQEETTSKETDMKNPTQEEAIPKETNMEILEGNIKSIGNESHIQRRLRMDWSWYHRQTKAVMKHLLQ